MEIHERDNFLYSINWNGDFFIMQAFPAFGGIKIDEMATISKS